MCRLSDRVRTSWRRSWRYFATIAAALLAAVVATVFLYLALLFISYGFNPDFFAIDACLDDGQRWNYEDRRCEIDP
jgi:hypothetical protein